MMILLIAGVVICSWTFLGVLTGERERRLRDVEIQNAIEVKQAAAIAKAQGDKAR